MADTVVKRLELAFRRALTRALARAARRPRAHVAIPDSPRILLLRHDRFGDAIVSTAIMKLLRERYPDARIDILLGRRNAAIASLLPAIDRAHVLGSGIGGLRAIAPVLRAERYDVVINLLAKDSTSGAILAILSGARLRVGFAGALADIYDFPIPRPSRPMHIVPETALLLAPFGVREVGDRPTREAEMLELAVRAPRSAATPANDRGARIVFSISARDEDHTWPDSSVEALAVRLGGDGIALAIAGTPEHRARVEAIASRSGARALPGSGSFAGFVEQLSAFEVIVTPQTSTVHVGSALRIATILLNTDTESDRQWTPWGVAHRTLSRGARLALISVDEVADAIRSLLAELRGS